MTLDGVVGAVNRSGSKWRILLSNETDIEVTWAVLRSIKDVDPPYVRFPTMTESTASVHEVNVPLTLMGEYDVSMLLSDMH